MGWEGWQYTPNPSPFSGLASVARHLFAGDSSVFAGHMVFKITFKVVIIPP